MDKENLTAGGNPSVDINDLVAKALRGMQLSDLKNARENGLGDRWAEWERKGLNPGQFRMNLGNVLRGMVRREARVIVGGRRLGGKK